MEVLLIKKVTKCILRLFAACFAVELAAFPIAQTEQGALCWVFPFTLSLCFLLPVPGHLGEAREGKGRGSLGTCLTAMPFPGGFPAPG